MLLIYKKLKKNYNGFWGNLVDVNKNTPHIWGTTTMLSLFKYLIKGKRFFFPKGNYISIGIKKRSMTSLPPDFSSFLSAQGRGSHFTRLNPTTLLCTANLRSTIMFTFKCIYLRCLGLIWVARDKNANPRVCTNTECCVQSASCQYILNMNKYAKETSN